MVELIPKDRFDIQEKKAPLLDADGKPKTSIFKTFSVKGYLIIAFMITLGITLKRIPQVPDSFIAWFYCGLGPGLPDEHVPARTERKHGRQRPGEDA